MSVNQKVMELQKLRHRYEHNDTLDHLYRFRDAGKKKRESTAARKKEVSREVKDRFTRAMFRVRLMMWATALILVMLLTEP